jgi:Zinc finger, C2H2 type
MSNSRENCSHCSETFYQQYLFPLEYVDFAFGGQNITLIGSFVETSIKNPSISNGCSKICRTCLELLRSSFSGTNLTVMNDDRLRMTHICATCSDFFPTSVMMSMQLTVISFDGQSVKLLDCYQNYSKKEVHSGFMVCLACVSAIANLYVKQKLENQSNGMLKGVKLEPISMDAVYDCEPQVATNHSLEVICKAEPELIIENQWNENSFTESIVKPDPETSEPQTQQPTPKRRKKRRPSGHLVRLEPDDDPELFKSLIDPYECSFCKERFRQRIALTEHIKQHRSEKWPGWPGFNKTNQYPCPICNRVMITRYQLKRHLISSHYANNTYECHHCPVFKTLTKANLEEHLLIRHFNIEQKCPDCPIVLPNRREYMKHIKKHQLPDQLQCPGCKRCFANPQHYRFHIDTYKTVINCKQCDAGFHTVRTLDTHMQIAHKFVFTCDECQMPLANRLTMNSHLRILHNIHVKPSCKYCGQEFDSIDEMMAHQRNEHVSRNYICETCGKNFITRSTMLTHVSRRHMDDVPIVKEKCPICGRELKDKKILQRHIKAQHTNKKPKKSSSLMYSCPKCPQWRFGRHQQLDAHMIVHNTENRRFFHCLNCGIAFTRKQKFDLHMQKCSNISE